MPAEPLPESPSLENLRKQAKSLRKAVHTRDSKALARVREFHPRADEATRKFSLSDSQLVTARSYGFASWLKLKRHLEVVDRYSWSMPPEPAAAEDSAEGSEAMADRFIRLACLNYSSDWAGRQDQARELLAANPLISQRNIYAASTVGDVAAVRRILRDNPDLAKMRGGPFNWESLLYAAYSRINSNEEQHSTLEVARLLLQHGADPNSGFLWHGMAPPFTALTGAFGEGEAGPVNQPQHQYCYQLARLLLEAGADPNDDQSLYNRMFTQGTRHLELLFEFGLGKGGDGVWFKRLGGKLSTPSRMLDTQMGWAAQHNHMDRVIQLVEHGVDVNSTDNRLNRLPYEIALLNGNKKIAQYLLDHDARKTSINDLDVFASACLAADASGARALLKKDSTLLQQLADRRVELLNRAAGDDKREAIRLMAGLGFDLNEIKGTAPLHQAAWSGHLEMVKLLIELGADLTLRDAVHNGTPLGWAEYSHQTEVAEFLRQFEPSQPGAKQCEGDA
jgi:ankyrin repeat protein